MPTSCSNVGITSASSTRSSICFPAASRVRQFDQQWHLDGFIVEKNPVGIFSMSSQRFSVIGHYRDHRVVI